MIEIVEVNCIEELSQYRLVWNSLFPGTPNATFFLTFDWLDTYWRHFGHDQKLRVLIVFAGGEPIGILPLCVRAETSRLSRVRVLTYPLDDWSTWYGPIGPNPASTMLAAMQHIRRTPRDWDMMELRWVADEATQGGKSARAMRAAGLFSEKQEYQHTSLVDLPASWDEFLASKSEPLSRKLRRTLIDVFADKRVQYTRHRPLAAAEGDGDPRWDLYAMCESLSQARWQPHATNGDTRTDERVREYFRAAHATAARLGMVDINVLTLENQPTAFLYGYHYQGNITALRAGSSVGGEFSSALQLTMIEDSCRRGDRTIDFGPGEHDHKRRLRTRTESTYRLTYTPLDSWRSQAVRFSRWAKRRFPRHAVSAAG